jgi:ribosome-binding factor A
VTKRQQQVNSLLQKEISSYLVEVGFEEITGFLTITGVDVSPDLEHAKVFFSVVGQKEAHVQAVLQKHIYEIQGMLMGKIRMRKIPRIAFVLDTSGEYAQHISKLIHDLHEDDSQQ